MFDNENNSIALPLLQESKSMNYFTKNAEVYLSSCDDLERFFGNPLSSFSLLESVFASLEAQAVQIKEDAITLVDENDELEMEKFNTMFEEISRKTKVIEDDFGNLVNQKLNEEEKMKNIKQIQNINRFLFQIKSSFFAINEIRDRDEAAEKKLKAQSGNRVLLLCGLILGIIFFCSFCIKRLLI